MSSNTSTADSVVYDELVTDEMTTTELLQSIEYNTRMTSQGVAHIFTIGIVLLAAMATWIIIKRWYFGGV